MEVVEGHYLPLQILSVFSGGYPIRFGDFSRCSDNLLATPFKNILLGYEAGSPIYQTGDQGSKNEDFSRKIKRSAHASRLPKGP